MLLKQSFRAVIVKIMQICCLNDEQLRVRMASAGALFPLGMLGVFSGQQKAEGDGQHLPGCCGIVSNFAV